MPFLGPIDITLELDGKPLEEYAIKTIANETKVGCHVASQVDKNFAICIRQLEPPPDGYKRMAEVIVDGKRTNKTILHVNTVTRIAGYRVKKDVRRPFVFAAVPIPTTPMDGEGAEMGDQTETQGIPTVDPNQTQNQPQTRPKLSSSHPNPRPIQNPHFLPAKRCILPLSSIGTIQILIATVKLKPKASNPNRRFQPRAGPGTREALTDVTILPDLVYLPGQGGAIEDGMEVHYTELDKGVRVQHAGGMVAEVSTRFPIHQFDYRYTPVAVLRSEGLTRFTRSAPFMGISLLPTGIDPPDHKPPIGPGVGLGRAGSWAHDVDTGSELLDEVDRTRYRELKLEIAARQRMKDIAYSRHR